MFDYGRFECDSGLAYRSVILSGKMFVAEDAAIKQWFCERLMEKYGKPKSIRPRNFFPRLDVITVYAMIVERMTGKQRLLPCAFRAVAGNRPDQDTPCAAGHGWSVAKRGGLAPCPNLIFSRPWSAPTSSIRPIAADDWSALYAAGSDREIWKVHPVRDRYTEAGFARISMVRSTAKWDLRSSIAPP